MKRRSDEVFIVPQQFDEPEAFAYFRGLLEWTDLLSVALRQLPIERGVIYGFVPKRTVLERPKDIEWPLPALSGHTEEARAMARKFVQQFLRRWESAVGLFQMIHSEGDPIRKLSVPYLFFAPNGPEQIDKRMMCLCLTNDLADDEHVTAAFRHARAFTFLAVLTRLPSSSELLRPGSELSADTVGRLAAATEHLVAEAFDGDSYFVWSREKYTFPFDTAEPPTAEN